MSDAAELTATIRGRDINLRSLLQELRRDLMQADRDAERTGRSLGANVAAGASQGERATLQYAQSLASVQRVQGDLAGAVETYRGALASLTPNTLEANRATVQLIQTESQLQRSLQGGSSYAQAFGSEIKGQLLGMIGPAAAASAAIAAIGGAVDLAKTGAQASQVEARFNQLSQTAGTTGTALKTALQQASGGEITDLNLELAANRAMMLGVADSAQEFSVLMAIARDRAQALGTDTSSAFNDLVTGLGRGSAEILDNLGLMVSVKEANEAYAASIGKTADQLTKAEQKQALINAVLAQGQASLAQSGGAMETSAARMAQTATAWENAMNRIGAAIANAYDPTTDAKVLNWVASLFPDEATAQAQANVAAIQQSMQQVQITLQTMATAAPESAAAIASLTPQIDAVGQSSAANAQAVLDLVNSYYAGSISATDFQTQLAALQAEQAAQEATTAAQTSATDTQTASTQLASQAAQDAAASLVTETEAKVQSTSQGQALTKVQATIAQLGGQVAAGLATASGAAAQLATQYNITTAAAYALVAAQAAVAAGEARLRSQAAQTRNLATPGYNAPGRSGNSDADMNRAVQLQQEARAQQEVARTMAASTKAVQANTAARHTNRSGGTARARSDAKAAGTARLAEEQKTAQKLVDLEEDTAKKRAEVERDHQVTMAKIAEDGAKKRQEAMERYSLNSKQDRASFYKQLGNVDDPQLRAQLSAQYEQIQQDAAKMAQEQGADVAQAYREAALNAAQAQADIQQEIAKAREEGDMGKAEYLEGVAKLQAEADQAEIDSIKTKGSAISAEQARQYVAEEEAYRKHLDQMLADYQEKMGKMGNTVGLPPVSTIPPPTSVSPVPAASPSSSTPAPVKDAATSQAVDTSRSMLSSDLSSIKDAVEKVERAVREVIGAVRSLDTMRAFKS